MLVEFLVNHNSHNNLFHDHPVINAQLSVLFYCLYITFTLIPEDGPATNHSYGWVKTHLLYFFSKDFRDYLTTLL